MEEVFYTVGIFFFISACAVLVVFSQELEKIFRPFKQKVNDDTERYVLQDKEEVNSEIRNIIRYFDSVEEIAVSYGGTEAKMIMGECAAARAEAYRVLDKIMLDYDIIGKNN